MTYEDNDDDDDDNQRNNDNCNDHCDYDSNRYSGLLRCRHIYEQQLLAIKIYGWKFHKCINRITLVILLVTRSGLYV